MNLDKDELLSKVKALLEEEMARIPYTTHVKSLGIESINDDKIVLIAHSKEQKDAIERRFYDLIQNTFKYLTNKDYKLEVIEKTEEIINLI